MILVILGFICFSLIVKIIYWNVKNRRKLYSKSVHLTSKITLKVLNVKVHAFKEKVAKKHLKDKLIIRKNKAHFIVSNHMGVLDILIIAAEQPTLFVTSVDMRETPGLGFLTEMAGCLYVERRSRLNIHNEIQQIREALQQNLNITLYPEGMATNGEKVHPFKKSLLTAAAGTDVPLQPVVVNFRKVNGEKMSLKWRDYVCWYGKQSFFAAMFRTLSTSSIHAEIEYLEPLKMHSDEERRIVAETLHQKISQAFTPLHKEVEST